MVVDYHIFPSKFSSLTVPKKVLEETLCAAEISWDREILQRREGISQISVEKLFCLIVTKKFVKKPSGFEKFLLSKSFMNMKGKWG